MIKYVYVIKIFTIFVLNKSLLTKNYTLMKKSITSLFLMLACSFGAQAQTDSYPFDAADVDENGWLWFDTPEKIEKYVGISEDGKLDPNGKIFQMISTKSASDALPPFNETFASDTVTGFGDPKSGGTDVKKGAIVMHKATENALYNNGGAVLINLPSCKMLSMNLSCESAAQLYLSGTNDAEADTSAYSIVYLPQKTEWFPGMAFYQELFRTDNFTWEGIHMLNNNGASEFTFSSKNPVYGMLQVAGLYPVYLHGIKVILDGTSTNIRNITTEDILFDGQNVSLATPAQISVYNIDGALVSSEYADKISLSGLNKGLYLVKAGNATRKIAIK